VTRLDTLRKRLRREPPGAEEPAGAGDGRSDPSGGREATEAREPHAVAAALADARKALGEVAAASGRAAASIRGRSRSPDGDAPAADLLDALAERVDAMREETARLARVLDRAEDRLTGRPQVNGNGRPEAATEQDEAVMRQVRSLVSLLAGAGASRQEIAAWVFREHGIVVSDQVIEEVVADRPAHPG
jgi:hypothetical protein